MGKPAGITRSRKLLPVLFIAASVVIHILIVASALGPAGSRYFFDSEVIAEPGCDFYALYVAGDNLRRGRSVYEHNPSSVATPCHFRFRYLPPAALLGLPFSLLTPRVAYYAWVGVIEICLLACLILTWYLAGGNLRAFAPAAALWLCFSPLYLELRMGQYSLLQAFFVMAAATSLRLGAKSRLMKKSTDGLFQQSNWSFSLFFGASLCWKLNTWIAAPSLIRAKRFKTLGIAALVLTCASLPHFILFPGSLQAFIQNLQLEGVAPEHGFTRGNMGLAMLVGVLSPETFSPRVVRLIFLVVFLAGCVLIMTRRHIDLAEQITLWLALSLLAYMHTWEHHFVMALPALTFLGLRNRGAFFWVCALLLAAPTPYILFRGAWQPWQLVLYHAWKVFGLGGILLLAFASKSGKRQAGS